MSAADELKQVLDGNRAELLARMCDEVYVKPQQPDEFTRQELAIQTGVSIKTIENRLKKLCDSGVITSRKAPNHNGNMTVLYKYADQP